MRLVYLPHARSSPRPAFSISVPSRLVRLTVSTTVWGDLVVPLLRTLFSRGDYVFPSLSTLVIVVKIFDAQARTDLYPFGRDASHSAADRMILPAALAKQLRHVQAHTVPAEELTIHDSRRFWGGEPFEGPHPPTRIAIMTADFCSTDNSVVSYIG
jgi:hypothetical protein